MKGVAEARLQLGRAWKFIKTYPRAVALVSVLVCATMALDFYSRIFVPREPELRVWRAPAPVTIFNAPDAAVVSSALTAWLPAAPVDQPKPRDIVVQGVFTGNGVRVAALVLRPVGTGIEERRLVSVGEQVEGWTVDSIAADSVQLSKGEERKAFKLLPGI